MRHRSLGHSLISLDLLQEHPSYTKRDTATATHARLQGLKDDDLGMQSDRRGTCEGRHDQVQLDCLHMHVASTTQW